ncbi:MIP family Ig-specific serine endopeptidase [Candidatus Mycoplasma pogonae]
MFKKIKLKSFFLAITVVATPLILVACSNEDSLIGIPNKKIPPKKRPESSKPVDPNEKKQPSTDHQTPKNPQQPGDNAKQPPRNDSGSSDVDDPVYTKPIEDPGINIDDLEGSFEGNGSNTSTKDYLNSIENMANKTAAEYETFYRKNYLKDTEYYKALPNSAETNFGKDEINRTLENDYYKIANQKVAKNLPVVTYNTANDAMTINTNGEVVKRAPASTYGQTAPRTYDTNYGLANANDIPSEMFEKILNSTASIQMFYPNKPNGIFGTIWAFDWKKTFDGSYPLTWYFGTNAHIARHIANKNNYGIYGTEVTEYLKTNPGDALQKVKLFKISNYSQKLINNVDSIAKKGVYSNDELEISDAINNVKVVYMGYDFLKSKPHDFDSSLPANEEEVLDFAVLEITFANQEEAKKWTGEYATKINSRFDFRRDSYIKKPNLRKSPDFYIAGYPRKIETTTLWTSKRPSEIMNSSIQIPLDVQKQGVPFSNSKYHSTIGGYMGIMDQNIWPINIKLDVWGKKYIFSGLNYVFRHAALGGGSSGSRVVNEKGETFAVNYGDFSNGLEGIKNDAGLAIALKSERYLYSNLKDYYIQAYDIIFGSGEDQKSSYLDALKVVAKNNSNFETHLFSKQKLEK